jgi:hypothetical protein
MPLPDALSDSWTRQEIVSRLRDGFGLDYDFVIQQDLPLDSCRLAYLKQYELWKRHDSERLERFAELLAAYGGQDMEESRTRYRNMFRGEGKPIDLAAISRRSRAATRLNLYSFILFVVTGAAFVTAAIVLANVV